MVASQRQRGAIMAERAKTVFITGAGSGIGLATVERFLAAGWNAAALDRSAERLAESFPKKNDRLVCITGSTTDRAALGAAADEVAARFGSIDTVFANAGIHHVNSLETITDAQFDDLVAVNIKGTINTLQAALPHIKAAGGGAMVINASDQALIGKRQSLGYGLTKGALGQMTRSLALDMAEYNIRVNAVCPGTIRTRLGEEAFAKFIANNPNFDVEQALKQEAELYPVKRIGEPADVAGLVYFLSSEEAGFITGSLYSVDGGLTAQ
jgi:NAD(P)-dependent dehydrogenase (short-subunit alcohol dehydrogenase family)